MANYEQPVGVVFGNGNDALWGPSIATLENGRHAANLVINDLIDPDLIFALGRGQYPHVDYPITESKAIEKEITNGLTSVNLAVPNIVLDEKSSNTIENVANLAELIESYDSQISALGIITAPGHANRVIAILEKIMGKKKEYVPMPRKKEVAFTERPREIGQTALFRAVTLGVKPGDRSRTLQRSQMLSRVLNPIKPVIGKVTGGNSPYSI